MESVHAGRNGTILMESVYDALIKLNGMDLIVKVQYLQINGA